MFESIGAWIGALNLPGRVIFGLLLFCMVVLALDWLGLVTLAALHPLATVGTILALALFGCLSVAALSGIAYDEVVRRRSNKLIATRREIRRQELRQPTLSS